MHCNSRLLELSATRTLELHFRGNFRIGGDSPGIMDCGFQALNACIGDFTETESMPTIAI